MIQELHITDFTPSADKTIWDVRDASSYQEGHIAHAQNQPLDSINAELLAQTTGDIYVLCGGGTKAGKACALLETLDPTRKIIHLTGGTRGAKAAGMTIISE
ncbi:sulfurtransferase [Moraxella caviae]|uniref:Molybdopterin biosynthesis protein MoeB n=1 Tax=Moraxella caviae TaxID=34060 RepID=A0A1S9ZYS9_9GAMM|nr:rhodanese-like domain-containing protein [Moraxella caviae]OOR88111.1 sulfurtransferase [Moraxella caviae]STZ09940.1 molybdopterin biosynthesis protein MoeB [Moraxella caviae]VEW13082.1 molybdopterin biosynthesis protein MoeB [Moraxella caviae]